MTLSRRHFLAGASAGLALASLSRPSAWAGPATVDEAAIKKLYQRAMVVDMLGGLTGWEDEEGPSPASLDAARASGVTVVSSTIAVEDFEAAVAGISGVGRTVDAHADRLLLVRKHADLAAAKKSGRVAIILNSQGSLLYGRELDRVDHLVGLGLRITQLTYNKGDLVGDGCLEPRDGGLTRFGLELVERLDSLRVAIDVSHSGARTTLEGIQASKRPVLITHSGCSAVFSHPRNKDDATLERLAERGGVLGIYFMPFVGRPADGGPATAAMVLDHIDHALRVVGEDHVGLGTDGGIPPVPETAKVRQEMAEFAERRRKAGIGAPEEERPLYVPELNHVRRFEQLALGMARRGHGLRVIEKVLGANFQRVLGDIWGK